MGRNPSGRFVLGVESVRFDTSAARSCGLPWHVAEAALGGAAAAGGPAGVGAGAEAGSAAQASGSSGGGGGGGACTLRLLQSHGDAVLELPPGATLLAVSGERLMTVRDDSEGPGLEKDRTYVHCRACE